MTPGYKYFCCPECHHMWDSATRDVDSPSGDACPRCDHFTSAHGRHAHPEWKVDESGNLTELHPGADHGPGYDSSGEMAIVPCKCKDCEIEWYSIKHSVRCPPCYKDYLILVYGEALKTIAAYPVKYGLEDHVHHYARHMAEVADLALTTENL